VAADSLVAAVVVVERRTVADRPAVTESNGHPAVIPHFKYRLQIIGAALLFSTGGAAIKATSLNAWQVAGFRSGVAAIAILLLIPGARRNWTWRAAAIGLAYALTLVFFVAANKLTTAANAIYLQSTAPLYLLVLSPLILKERIRPKDLLLMSVVACGLACVFLAREPARATAPNPFAGNIVALLSGLTYGLTLTGLRWIASHPDARETPMATVALGNILACLICLPAALPVAHSGTFDWVAILYLGVFQISLAYYLLGAGIRHVPAVEAGTLLLVEPALNPVWTWLLHGERPSPLAICGGVLILAASAIRTRLS
jgi:DME family drug/metabolite transporter